MKKDLIITKLNANLFQFLAKSLPNRTSRFDAFLELFNEQIGRCNVHPNGINVPIGITYDYLAKKWNWDRKTVMSFLKSLQEMGVLEYKRSGYCMEVRILNLAYSPRDKESNNDNHST